MVWRRTTTSTRALRSRCASSGRRQLALEEKFRGIALPRLATGVGRLPWADMEPFIHENFGDRRIPMVVYTTCRKGVQAQEGL